MKNFITTILLSFVLLLTGCQGADTYQGTWKATGPNGKKVELNFEPKSFTVKDSTGKVSTYQYTQNSVKVENSVTIYGIQLGDGRVYRIFFPFANDISKGVIMFKNNEPIYTISRSSYITYKDLYKLEDWN